MEVYLNRIANLRKVFEKNNLDAFILNSYANRVYLSAFESSFGWLVVSRSSCFLCVDSRYEEAAKKIVAKINKTATDGRFIFVPIEDFKKDFLSYFIQKEEIKRIGFEAKHLSHATLNYLKKSTKIKWVATFDLVENLRAIKDKEEIKQIEKAVEICDRTFKHILGFIKPGVREREIAWELERFMRESGAEKAAWHPFIVAVGSNSAMPHYGSGLRKIKKGDQVQLDFGAVVAGYASDFSRVVFVGNPDDTQKKIYTLVSQALELGKEIIQKKTAAGRVDEKVKEWLRSKSDHIYRHGLGHGVGLEIHEKPTLYIGRAEKLQAGNVFTIEPGIYIPLWGGVRLEDVVILTDNRLQTITKSPLSLKEVII